MSAVRPEGTDAVGPSARRPPRSLAVNASANAIRVVVGAATAVISTAVVTRQLSADQYGVWGLVLQLSTYFFLFDVGLTLSVSRAVAVSVALPAGDEEALPIPAIVSSAAAALSVIAAAGAVVVVALSLRFDDLFHTIPSDEVADARWAFVLVAGSLLAGLPFATVTGYFNGVRRSHVPAGIALVVKLATTAGVITVAVAGGGIVGLALVTAVMAFAGAVTVLVAGERDHPHLVSRHAASVATWRRLRSFSAHAFFFAMATFAIVNLDAVLVARFDYSRLGAYIIAGTVVATLGATHYAAVSALLPVVSEMAAPDRHSEVLALVRRSSRYSTIFVVATAGPLLVGATVILQIWVGDSFAAAATGPLRLLLLAAIIRFTCSVLTQAYFGLADRWPVTISVAVEAVTNLAASIALGRRYGAPGVALGTLVGAVAGVLTYLVLAPRRVLGMRLPSAVAWGAARPGLALVPIALSAPWWYGWDDLSDITDTVVAVVAVVVSFLWLLRCLDDTDRHRLRGLWTFVLRKPASDPATSP